MDGGYTITNRGRGQSGTIFDRPNNIVIVHDGSRGQRGPKGDKGDKGDPGRSINIYGAWERGQTYCPGDAVTDRSRLVDFVQSLYIQTSAYPCSPSLEAPHENPLRWVEIGAKDWDNAFGGIWEVYQLDHGFTKIGQPVGFSHQADRYVLAAAGNEDELAIAVVREVIDKDRVILQSSGEVPNIDPAVIYPDGSDWDPGRIYYVSTARGKVEIEAPLDNGTYVNPILMAADQMGIGGRNGIALPWTPVSGRAKEYIPVGLLKFYFIATAGQTAFTGLDMNGETLRYIPGPNTEVFRNGLNLFDGEFTATDGITITLTQPAAAGDEIEIWTPDRPLNILVRSTMLKVDNVESQFDGVRTQFDLLYNGEPVVFQDAVSAQLWLDTNPQEPLVDYQIIDNGSGGAAAVFKEAPEEGTRFWGIALSPVGQAGNLPAGGATGAVLSKASADDYDTYWADEIHGGTW